MPKIPFDELPAEGRLRGTGGDTRSTLTFLETCQWIPSNLPLTGLRPPMCRAISVTLGSRDFFWLGLIPAVAPEERRG